MVAHLLVNYPAPGLLRRFDGLREFGGLSVGAGFGAGAGFGDLMESEGFLLMPSRIFGVGVSDGVLYELQ
jgi:hypothetical protein